MYVCKRVYLCRSIKLDIQTDVCVYTYILHDCEREMPVVFPFTVFFSIVFFSLAFHPFPSPSLHFLFFISSIASLVLFMLLSPSRFHFLCYSPRQPTPSTAPLPSVFTSFPFSLTPSLSSFLPHLSLLVLTPVPSFLPPTPLPPTPFSLTSSLFSLSLSPLPSPLLSYPLALSFSLSPPFPLSPLPLLLSPLPHSPTLPSLLP